METMLTKEELEDAFENMVVSASGWRAVFNVEHKEESHTKKITDAYAIITYLVAQAFSKFLHTYYSEIKTIVIGQDTRPTSETIIISALLAFQDDTKDFEIKNAEKIPIPQLISYASFEDAAFFYVSASHNPIGYNGFKFGIGKTGVLAKQEVEKLLVIFKDTLNHFEIANAGNILQKIKAYVSPSPAFSLVSFETECTYFTDVAEIATKIKDANEACEIYDSYKELIKDMKQPIYILVDYNGGARSHGIDKYIFSRIGINFLQYNQYEIVHGIIPEGDNLNYISCKLTEVYKKNNGHGIFLSYMPDCDGDRGNIVYMDDEGEAKILKSQEVLAIVSISEIIHKRLSGSKGKIAIVVNGPTSLLIDKIASYLGVYVFRAEVGEANVIDLATKMENIGYEIAILGEGSNGGCIIPHSRVRDPLNTLFSILKIFFLQGSVDIFKVWEEALGIEKKDEPLVSFSKIVNSLPRYNTTPISEERAMLKIKIDDVRKFREVFQSVFLKEWMQKKEELKEKYGIESYRAFSYVGCETIDVSENFSLTNEGGFKIVFYNECASPISFIWMRASGTEPVFRLMADVKDIERLGSTVAKNDDEIFFVSWEKEMVERTIIKMQKDEEK